MKSKKEGDPVSGKVTKKIKGGLLVDIGVPVFLPASQVDIRRPGEISDWIGRHIDAMILKIDEERRNIVICRRKMIEQQREELKKKTLESLAVGTDRQGHRQEHRRLRRVHRPRRHRRPAAHHRHVLGPDQPPQRDAQDRPGGRGQGPVDRQGQGEDRAGPEAEGRQPVGEHRDQVPGRLGARGRGRQHHVLRRVLQARGRRRRPGAHLRDVAGPSASTTRAKWSRRARRCKVKVLEINKDKQEISPRHEAGRGEPLGARGREVPAGLGRRGQGPQHRQLRRVRRDRGRHRRPAARLATCRGRRRSATPRKCSRRARRSRRSCSASTRRSSGSRWA